MQCVPHGFLQLTFNIAPSSIDCCHSVKQIFSKTNLEFITIESIQMLYKNIEYSTKRMNKILF